MQPPAARAAGRVPPERVVSGHGSSRPRAWPVTRPSTRTPRGIRTRTVAITAIIIRARPRDGERRMFWVLLLTGGFMVVEAVGGWLAGSLALIADAGHMLSDTAALALAWAAFRVARRPHDAKRTYGYHRFEILAAFANGLALFAIAGGSASRRSARLRDPSRCSGCRCSSSHVPASRSIWSRSSCCAAATAPTSTCAPRCCTSIGDLLGSAGAIAAAIVILATGWTPIDPILSIFMTLLILRGAWDVTRRAGHVLMEGTPDGFDAAAMRADLMTAVPGLTDVHHVHAWMLNAERPVVTLHVCLAPSTDAAAALAAIKVRLKERFGIAHSTVQIDPGDCID